MHACVVAPWANFPARAPPSLHRLVLVANALEVQNGIKTTTTMASPSRPVPPSASLRNRKNSRAGLFWLNVLIVGTVLLVLYASDLKFWTDNDREIVKLRDEALRSSTTETRTGVEGQQEQQEQKRIRRYVTPSPVPLLKIDPGSMPTITFQDRTPGPLNEMTEKNKKAMFASLRNLNGSVRQEERNKYRVHTGRKELPIDKAMKIKLPVPPHVKQPGPIVLERRGLERYKYHKSIGVKGEPKTVQINYKTTTAAKAKTVVKTTVVNKKSQDSNNETGGNERSSSQQKESTLASTKTSDGQTKPVALTSDEIRNLTKEERDEYIKKIMHTHKDAFEYMAHAAKEHIDPDLQDFAKSIGKARRNR